MKNPSEKRLKKEKKKRDNRHVNKPVSNLNSDNGSKQNLNYFDNDPVRFLFYSNKKEVSLGEELELSITAQYITLHPGLLTVFPGSNAFSLKVIVPHGFVQTGGDYIDLIGAELSSSQKTVTYTLRGKFTSVPDDHSFRLLRSHKNAGTDSKFVEKGKLQVTCRNSVEQYAINSSSKEFRLAAVEVVCTPFSEVCSGNNQEIRNQTITVAQSGSYSLVVNYRSPEKVVSGIVRIDGVAQTVTFPQIATYQNQTVGTVSLSAGTHTIGLSSGSAGGYICFNNICLTNTTPSTPTCDFSISASSSNANPGCGATITLNAGCSGNDCSGVSYNWSTGQNGQSVNTTAANSNGNTTYTVTATKTGCATKTAQANVTVSGCGSTSTSCTPFAEACSGNSQEIRNQTITVAQSGNYSLVVNYRSPEKVVSGIVRIDGVAQTVTFPQIATYQNQTVGTVSLSAGTHTIGLSSGVAGGYICFNNICITNTTPSTPTCDYTITASSSNANPGCGAAITLNAGCSGNDCSGVSYNWSTGQNGQSVNTTAANSNGTTTYTVTVTKTGCATKTAQANVTVSGCGTTGTLNGCYVIRSKKSGQLMQALSGDVVEQRAANNLSNQIWKAESVGTNQYRFTVQDGSNKSMQVNAANQDDLVRIGTYSGADLQKWNLQSNNNGSYRVSASNGLTWDLRNYADDSQLQLWGNINDNFVDYRLFGFESVGCPVSPPTTGSCTTLRNADSPANLTSGLAYRYFQTIANNDWCTSTGLSTQPVVSSGSVNGFNLTPRLRDENFGLEFTGYIQVPADGQYTFFLSSDDESRLYIGGQLVAVHNGCHDIALAGQEPSGSICLRAGYHPIQVLYSQGVGGFALKTYWQGPSITKQEIPVSALFRSGASATSCDFVVNATSPATAACSSAITLNAPCTGNDCSGISYSWSTGQNGQSVNTSAANSNGTTTYTVTATKNGCANKTAQVNIIVTSCPSNTNVATKTFMLTSIGDETWSDNQNHMNRRYVNMESVERNKPNPDDQNLKVTDIEHITRVMNYWHDLGGTHVSMPMNWDDTEMSPGIFEFRHWNWIFSKAESLGLKVNINLMPLVDFKHSVEKYRTSASWRYEMEDGTVAPVDSAGKIIRDKNRNMKLETVNHFMSYFSPKRANYLRWLNGVANYLASHTNSIGYVAVVTNHHKEANYYLSGNTDYHPNALAAWYNKYPGVSNPPEESGGSDEIHRRWLKFRSETLMDFVSEWVGILKAKNLKTVLDVGSFTDNNSNRGTWALLDMLPPNLDGVKHNPAWDYPAGFDTRIVASARPSLASVEWTRECNNGVSCPSSLVPYLIPNFKTSIDAGATDLSFAFFDAERGTPFPAELNTIVTELKNSNYWNKPIPSFPSNCIMEIKVKDVMSQGRYTSDFFLNIFNGKLNTCGGYPTIKVTNDLE